MKVLIITSNPTFGGASTANMLIAKSIALLGHNVYVNDEFFDYPDSGNITITKIPVHWHSHPIKSSMRKSIMGIDPDLIIWGLNPLLMSCLLDIAYFKIKGKKQFCIFHSLSFTNSIKSKIVEIANAVAITLLDKLIFVSKYTEKSWSKYFTFRQLKERSNVIYNPIQLPSGLSAIRKMHERPQIAFVGRFDQEKNPDLYCQLSTEIDCDFHFWGGGVQLESFVKKYPKVKFHGLERNIDLIYKDMDILMITSKIENCPMVILEAMSRGIPVIAPNVGGIPEIMCNKVHGVIFYKYSTEDIDSSIRYIISNYKDISVKCVENAQSFSVNEISKSWKKLLS